MAMWRFKKKNGHGRAGADKDGLGKAIDIHPEDIIRNEYVVRKYDAYTFIPLFEKPVNISKLCDFQRALSERIGRVELAGNAPCMSETGEEYVIWRLPDYPGMHQDESATLELAGPDIFDGTLWTPAIIAQFWNCGDQRDLLVRQSCYALKCVVTAADQVSHLQRYGVVANYADVVLQQFPKCIGIYWPHCQNLVSRAVYLHGQRYPSLHFLDGGLHVRAFHVGGRKRILFDTLGMTAIGLTDLQCYCGSLDPDEVYSYLRHVAAYLYQNGCIIEDGSTIEGADGGKWLCRYTDSQAAPRRRVLHIG